MKVFLIVIVLCSLVSAQSDDSLWGAWYTITPPAELIDEDSSVILIEFKESADSVDIIDRLDYTVTDDLDNNFAVSSIHWLTEIDNIDVLYSKLIALVVPKISYKRIYTVVFNGQSSSFFWSGYLPNLEAQPKLIIE